ncbi:adenine phosphoribosyltransferase, partial [bacterium]|nr:adenine phosphoribosyltransferase [bacterium]
KEKMVLSNLRLVISVAKRYQNLGMPLALRIGAGFVPVRKKKKLPYKTVSVSYELEYGADTVEMHEDAIRKGERVLILDDLLATGGTSAAIAQLVAKLGGQVAAFLFCLELTFLPGRKKLEPTQVLTLHKI